MSELESGSRVEALLRGILDGETSTTIEPATRVEVLLKAILEDGGGGGGGGGSDLPDVTSADAGDFLRVNDDGEWDKDAGDDLARIDGYYESLTSGQTEQIISKVGVTNAEPYRLRPTGGSADVGNRKKIGKIIGASAAWEQNFDPTFTVELTPTTSAKTNGIPAGTTVISGHKYLFRVTGENYQSVTSSNGIMTQLYTKIGTASPVAVVSVKAHEGANYVVFTADKTGIASGATNEAGGLWMYSTFYAADAGTASGNLTKYQLFDLTETFGSDVANVIAAKEATLAGSGLAWIRSYGYLTRDVYPAASNSFVSAKPSAHKTVGFNAWDEVWESGYLHYETGQNVANDNYIRSKNYIPVLPATDYYVNSPYTTYMRYYDEDKNFLGVTDGHDPARGDVSSPNLRTMPANCRFIRFYIQQTTYNSDICINLSHSGYRNGDYEAYSEHVYPLENTELKGILNVDESGNVYADGDTYAPDGTITKRYYEVSSADCTFSTYQLSSARWYLILPEAAPDIVPAAANEVGNIRASKYFTPIKMNDSNGSSYGICHTDTTAVKTRRFIFTIDSSAVTTQAEAETWVANHPFSILYERVESTDTGTAYAATMICDDFGTETFVDERTIPMPVGHETFYQANNADKLDHLPFPADADGDYIIHQSGKTMTLKATSSPLPALPTEDGSYNLKVTVSGDAKTLSWEAIS